jgi:hypothetical protein
VLVGAAALVLTLPPAGLANLGPSPLPRAVVAQPARTAVVAPIDRGGPFRAADFDTHRASADARFIADWVADSGDSRGMPYLILDKRDARLFVFTFDGLLIDSSPVLLGATPGDDSVEGIGTRPMSLVKQEEKTTPAGRFVAYAGRNAAHEEVVWVDYGAGGLDASRAPGRSEGAPPRAARLAEPCRPAHLLWLHQRSGRLLRIGGLAAPAPDPARSSTCCPKPAMSARSSSAPTTRA